ncbi:molybdopterin-dependent oxidoreductase [Chloroflexota bacterium]
MSREIENKNAICRWCHARCRVSVQVSGGHLVEVTEDTEHLVTVWPRVRGCMRRRAAREFFYHPKRVNYPLKRVGEKGEGKWQHISWEQALDDIAQKLGQIKQEYGPEAVSASVGTARTVKEFCSRFFNLFGSSNRCGSTSICNGPRAVMAKAIFGWFPHVGVSPKSKCYILWGRTPEESYPSIWYHIRNVKKAGQKLIVIDPRYTKSAALADIHLQPRPGTDCALALGMINVIINEELYNKEFVANWCHGFEQLSERVQQYHPEKVAEITWVPADKIKDAARMYATNHPGSITAGQGIEALENNAECIHAHCILAAITGNVSVEGGEVLYGPHPQAITVNEIELSEMVSEDDKKKQLGADRFKLNTWPGYDLITEPQKKVWGKRGGSFGSECMASAPLLYRAILEKNPYPVKAMITWDSNPMVTQANTKLVYKALKKLDIYVVVDFWMTPSAELADYIFPAGSWLERPCILDSANNTNVLIGGERSLPSTIEGEYDHRDDYEFWRGLGIRLGQERHWPWQTLEEVYDYRLQPMGLTFKGFMEGGGVSRPRPDFEGYKRNGFATPTGRVELYSTLLEKLGYDPLPAYREPSMSLVSRPDMAQDYPFILITGARHRPFFHSEYRQIGSLRKLHPEPLVEIHPETARELGIDNGAWVWIETPTGQVKQKCRYFAGMHPRIVSAQHGWWFPELPGEEPCLHGVWESNINVCLNDDPQGLNPLLGSWPLRTFLCKIYKVKKSEE